MSQNSIRKNTPVALSIAGSDSGGGAGIQADQRVFCSYGVYPTTVITALTAQNPNEVRDIYGVPPTFVASQLQTVLDAFDIKAIKTGMLYSAEIIQKLCAIFASPSFQSRDIPIIIDPVMIATSGAQLVHKEAIDVYKNHLFPLAELITPNIDEAEVLLKDPKGKSITITSKNQLQIAHQLQQKFGCAVLLKGGHLQGDPIDILIDRTGIETVHTHKRIEHIYSHGTGCSLSASIAAGLAKGWNIHDSVEQGIKYIQQSLQKPYTIQLSDNIVQLLGLENTST